MQYDMNRQPTSPRAGYKNSLPAPSRATYIYTGAGALVGLLIGLVFAWLIWPVQWTNAWPADLSQEARAQYLAAVSESYVYYGDAQAAETARNRLFNLNDDLAGYIADAQKFFVDNPQANSRVYINNLGQLAQALNVQSPEIIIETPIDVAPATDAAGEGGNEVGNGVRAWVNWSLTLLAALVLVIGGFYVVGRLNQRRLASADGDTLDDGGFEDEPGYVRPAPAAGYSRPLRGATGDAPQPDTYPSPREQYAFDEGFEDDEDAYYGRGAPSRTLDYRREDEVFDDPLDDEEYDDLHDIDNPLDNSLDSALGEPLDEPFAKSEPLTTRVSTTTVMSELTLDDDDEDDLELIHDDDEGDYLAAEAVAAEPEAATSPARASAGIRTLNTYTFQYHAGIADYDQSRPIVDPESGLQVGDCGMGVNVKNNVVQNNPDNVVALDVWLVDKKQEKSFSSQDRVLLSEYVIDHSLEATFTRDRPNDPSPIIPQPGTTFQIKGPSLTLDCVITEVTYIKNGAAAGMFQSLNIDMTVRSRT